MVEQRLGLVFIALSPICKHLDKEGRASCFGFIVFQVTYYCKYFVAFPHDALGWSAVCDYSIS